MKRILTLALVALGFITGPAIVPTVAQADVSPSVTYAYDSLRGLTGQAPDNDIGRWIVNTQNLFNINITNWRVANWIRVNDHHLHMVASFYWSGPGGSYGVLSQTFHAYVNWPHTPSLRKYHDGASH